MSRSIKGIPNVDPGTPPKPEPIWVRMDTPPEKRVVKRAEEGISEEVILDKKRRMRFKQLLYTRALLQRNEINLGGTTEHKEYYLA